MHLSESAEEILEALWTANEKGAGGIKLSDLRLMPETQELKELIDNGVLEQTHDKSFHLTEKGLILARDAVRRHRLAERLLTDVLAVKSSLIHETACQFEHHLHRGIDGNVCTLLGHPKFCPHGRPIPPGRCCEELLKTAAQAVSPLSQLKLGQGGHVAYLQTTDTRQAQMLLSMGIIPGTHLKLLALFPSLLFQFGESQFAVDQNVAKEIYVRLD